MSNCCVEKLSKDDFGRSFSLAIFGDLKPSAAVVGDCNGSFEEDFPESITFICAFSEEALYLGVYDALISTIASFRKPS